VPLSQIVKVDYKARKMQIGIKIDGNYLNNPEIQYPVTIDPTYTMCIENDLTGLSCNLTDFYLKVKNDAVDTSLYEPTALYIGYYKQSTSVYLTRHAVLKFNFDWTKLSGGVDNASLYMYYRADGSGGASTASFEAKRINTSDTIIQGSSYSLLKNKLVAENVPTTVNASPTGKTYIFDVTETINQWWLGNPNYGIVVEPTDNWKSGSKPPTTWPSNIFIFDDSSHSDTTGPYLLLTTSLPQVDLQQYTGSVTPVTLSPGEQFTFTGKVFNNGIVSAVKYTTVNYYFGKTVDFGASPKGSEQVLMLAPGKTDDISFSYQIPAGTAPGTYYFYYWIDATGQVSESNEDNNKLQAQITISGKADLTKSSDTISPVTMKPGEQLMASVTIKNIGTATAEASKIYYYFNNSVDWSVPYIDYDDVNSLGAGATGSEAMSYYIPDGTAPGTYYFYYWIDATEQVPESDEDNNYWQAQITVQAATNNSPNPCTNPLPPSGTDGISRQVTLGWSCSDPDGDSLTNYYIQIDNNSDFSSPLFSGWTGSSNKDWAPWLNGVDLDYSTKYYWRLYAKDEHGTNGSYSSTWNFTTQNAPAVPDIIVDNVSIINPGTTKLGGTDVQISARIRNTGNANASNFAVNIQMKNTATSDLLTLTNISPSMLSTPAGYDQIVTFTGHIVDSCALPFSANYEAKIKVDSDDVIAESNESNNLSYSGNNTTIQRYNFCIGEAIPPNQDLDAYTDVEEVSAGTSPVLIQPIKPIFDNDYAEYMCVANDKTLSSYAADPVNIRTGAFEFTQTDFALSGIGLPINFTRTYNSKLNVRNGKMGYGWSHSYDQYYYQDPNTKNVQLYLGGANASLFTTFDGGATFAGGKGETGILYWNGDSALEYRTQDGIKYVFAEKISDNMFFLSYIKDRNNNPTTLGYTNVRGVSLLTSITDASGRKLLITYGPDTDAVLWNKIVQIKDGISAVNPRTINYTYDSGTGDLLKAETYNIYNSQTITVTKSFVYDSNHLLLKYTDPRGTILTNEYDASGRVIKQYEHNPDADAPGANRLIYEISYSAGVDPDAPGSAYCSSLKTNFASGSSFTDKYCFNVDDLKIFAKDGIGYFQRWAYNGNGLVSSFIDKNGNAYSFSYDAKRRNIKQILPDANSWRTEINYTYEDNFNKIIKQEEKVYALPDTTSPALVRITSFSIDPNNGNLLSSTDAKNNTEYFSYDSAGNVLSHTDKENHVTNYAYGPSGNYLTTQTDSVVLADGNSQIIEHKFTYDNYGNRLSYTTPQGYIYSYEYDTRGNVRKIINPQSKTQLFSYDAEDHKISATDELNRMTNFTYDKDISESLIKIEQVGSAENIAIQRKYDWIGRLTQELDPRGNGASYVYDGAGRVAFKYLPYYSIEFEYDNNGNITKQTSSEGNKLVYIYDSRNNLLETRVYKDVSSYSSSKNTYDGLGRVVSSVNGNGKTTTFEYDILNNVIKKTDPLSNAITYAYDKESRVVGELYPRAQSNKPLQNADGYSVSYVYDGIGRLAKQIDADDKVSKYIYDKDNNIVQYIYRNDAGWVMPQHNEQYQYDSLGRQIVRTDAGGAVSSFAYDAVGNIISVTDPDNMQAGYIYDDFDRLTKITKPLNYAVQYAYDKAGNRVLLTSPNGKTTQFTYDNSNRLTKITDSLSGQKIFAYNGLGNILSKTDERGKTTQFAYDKLNRLIEETDANGTKTAYSYDSNGNRLSQSVAGKTTSYVYNSLNKLTSAIYPGNVTESYEYDADGNLISVTNGNNNTIDYTRNALSWITKAKPAGAQPIYYSYDNWGNMVSASDNAGTHSYSYNQQNLPVSESITFADLPDKTYTLQRQYTSGQRIKSITDAAGKTFDYSLNQGGLIKDVAYSGKNLVSYDYNSSWQVTQALYGNGAKSLYGYDDLMRTNKFEIYDTANGSNPLLSDAYTYDAASNRIKVQGTNNIDYTYDNLEQITKAVYSIGGASKELAFTYDKWGNRTQYASPVETMSYTYDNASDKLLSINQNSRIDVSNTYDNNGAITKQVYSRLGKQIKQVDYSWNTLGELESISYKQLGAPVFMPTVPDNILSFKYDYAGNRSVKSVNGVSTYYINDGLRVLNEINKDGNVSKSIVYGLGQIASVDSADKIQYIHTDVQGSAVVATDKNGVSAGEYDYDPFGTLIGKTGSATDYLYTGQEYDIESDLYYYNARYYNPRMGRFLSRDAIHGFDGDSISRNPYLYVKNNPLKYTDPSGKISWGTVWSGVKDLAAGCLDLAIGTVEGIAGVSIVGASLAAEAPSLGTSTVGVVGGAGVTALGLNNIVSGGSQSWGGIKTIWNGINDKEEVEDLRWNPAEKLIDKVIDKESIWNPIAKAGFAAVDFLAGGAGIAKSLKSFNGTKNILKTDSFIVKITGGSKPDVSTILKTGSTTRVHLGFHPFPESAISLWHVGVGTAQKTFKHMPAEIALGVSSVVRGIVNYLGNTEVQNKNLFYDNK
jgi:RHS repeat-associated protein